MRNAALIGSVALALAACGGGTLADIHPLKLTLIAMPNEPQPSLQVQVDHCGDVGGLTGTLDGKTMPPFTSLEASTNAVPLTPAPSSCKRPTDVVSDPASLPAAGEASATIVVADHSRTVTMQFGHLMAARTLVFVSPADGHLTAGQQVTLELQPGDDLDPAPPADGQLLWVGFRPTSGSSPAGAWGDNTSSGLTRDGARLTFTVPSNATAASGRLSVTGYLPLKPQRCEGAEVCEGGVVYDQNPPALDASVQ